MSKLLITVMFLFMASPVWALDASWYSVKALKRDGQWDITHGRCADGSLFKDDSFTAAYWGVALGTRLKVSTMDGRRSVIVIVTDRTARRFAGKRIDLTPKAFSLLAPLEQGLVAVRIEEVK